MGGLCDGSAPTTGRLAYQDSGTGDPLVLLHGGFLDHHMWDDQIPAFTSRFRVIAPDARGHGASHNATRPFRHTDDVAALLRALLRWPIADGRRLVW